MLRQQCSYKNDIETRRKPKAKKNYNSIVKSNNNKEKVSHLLRVLIYDDFSKNVIPQTFLLLL